MGRKNWLHLGSDKGGRTAAVLMSLVPSCQARKIEPFTDLRDVLDRVSSHPASQIADRLPDAWKPAQASRDNPSRKWSAAPFRTHKSRCGRPDVYGPQES